MCTQRSAHRGQGGGTAWRAGAVERFSESATSESRGQLPAGWPLRPPLRRRVEQERLSSAVPRRSKPSSCVTGAPSSTLASKSGAHHLGPLGFNFAQHTPTTRRSVEGICRESIFAFGSR
ncbi:hypothetical protein T484DRAFT_2532554 [Baffinella frigidus]|nr:hypothetical protein T484DRAFT_2532554 [Cryptophyta sp. CCMP2293]